MITSNPMQLKALIKKKAEEKRISAQLVLQNYMMERLLERISLSKYNQNFILKGGFLIAAIVGLDTRTTMDMDATVKGFSLTHESISSIFDEICSISIEDDVAFTVQRISKIREGDIYPCLRVRLMANYLPLAVPLAVDITTGDKITPREVEYSFRLMFDERSISIMAYNLETIFAEKLETVLSRNIANTRLRDFYDIHILYALRNSDCDMTILKQALEETTTRRGSRAVLEHYHDILANIQKNSQMRNFWERYRKEYSYASDIDFDDCCNTILLMLDNITLQQHTQIDI